MGDYEVVAQELSDLGEKIRSLEERVAEVERVNARLEVSLPETYRDRLGLQHLTKDEN